MLAHSAKRGSRVQQDSTMVKMNAWKFYTQKLGQKKGKRKVVLHPCCLCCTNTKKKKCVEARVLLERSRKPAITHAEAPISESNPHATSPSDSDALSRLLMLTPHVFAHKTLLGQHGLLSGCEQAANLPGPTEQEMARP
jgi:hypothetical protein